MGMTQKRANEIAYLGSVRGVVRYCDIKGITELTATEFLIKSEAEEEFAENIANVFHLEKAEAIAFTRFIFKDVVKALMKRKEEDVARVEGSSVGFRGSRG